MKRIVPILLALVLCVGLAACSGTPGKKGAGLLGQPFPDFTVTDTDGEAFTLSEELKNHEAVLICFFTGRSDLCGMEFHLLQEAYEKYGGRVSFLALSCDAEDTADLLEDYRKSCGLTFPVARDEGLSLSDAAGISAFPAAVIVDRFGSTVFHYEGGFKSVRELSSVLEPFLGADCTKTAVLNAVPPVTATEAFPASSSREIIVENDGIRQIFFTNEASPARLSAYIVEDDTARLRLTLPSSDNPYDMVCILSKGEVLFELPELLNAERDAYVLDVPMADGENGDFYTGVRLTDWASGDAKGDAEVYLIPGEEFLDALCETLGEDGWVFDRVGEPEPSPACDPQAYVIRAVDQYGDPVPDVTVNFCTEQSCVPARSDGDGIITFDGEPDNYHVQLLKVPEGYGFDAGFAFYTGSSRGEWRLTVRKD